jgi:uncharacterized phage protein (TIGR01671 family)
MRELKFRAWDNKNKKWLLGYEYPNLGGFSLFGECMLGGEWSCTFSDFLFENYGLKFSDLIVMQFTGIKDKNKKEVYEGDLYRRYSYLYRVIWRKEKAGFFGEIVGRFNSSTNEYDLEKSSTYFNLCEDEITEVIGNIYQNPNLIPSKQEI